MDVLPGKQSLIYLWQLLFAVTALIQFYYLINFYLRLALYKPAERHQNYPPVSVIIAARNEYDNLLANLPFILEQDYPEFQVIVINDSSWDDSGLVLEGFKSQYAHLYVITRLEHDRFEGGKKLAVTLGIKAAKHNRLILTDADCKPLSRQWLKTMAGSVQEADQIVLGYSPYRKEPGVLNAFIRFDSLLTAMNYLGFALAGRPYMGVGRNLSYSRDRFFEIGGFRRHYSLASGDDDLLVNELASKENTVICIEKDAVVESLPEQSWKHFWRQKKRHLTTGWKYKKEHKFLLMLQSLGLLLFVISTVILIANQVWLIAVISVVLLRILTQITIFRQSAKWLGQRDLVFLAPFLEIFVLIFSTCVHIANVSTKQTTWKT